MHPVSPSEDHRPHTDPVSVYFLETYLVQFTEMGHNKTWLSARSPGASADHLLVLPPVVADAQPRAAGLTHSNSRTC